MTDFQEVLNKSCHMNYKEGYFEDLILLSSITFYFLSIETTV